MQIDLEVINNIYNTKILSIFGCVFSSSKGILFDSIYDFISSASHSKLTFALSVSAIEITSNFIYLSSSPS